MMSYMLRAVHGGEVRKSCTKVGIQVVRVRDLY